MAHVDVVLTVLMGVAFFGLAAAWILAEDPATHRTGVSGGGALIVLAFLAGGIAMISFAAYHSGQTYHPCKTDFQR